jgi:hypothetical protein
MPTEPPPVTLSEVVHKAVEICDGGGGSRANDALDELLMKFQDDDEPISAIDLEERLDRTIGVADDDDPAFKMARAVIEYLAFRRDELGEDPARLLRLAARAEFDGHPPPDVERWLGDRGAL